MKVRIFLITSALEAIAKGETQGFSLDAYAEGHYYFDNPGSERTLLKEVEVRLPSRDAAVTMASKQIMAAKVAMEAYFNQRLSELQAITWEAPK